MAQDWTGNDETAGMWMDALSDPGMTRGQMRPDVLRRKAGTSISNSVSANQQPKPPQASAAATLTNAETPQQAQQRALTSADWYGKGLDEMNQPSDYSGAVESQKRSKTAAERALLLALAAGEAGPEFSTVQKHFLSRADTRPMKLAGATIDEQGNVVEDPEFQRTRRSEILLKRGDVASTEERKREEAAARKTELDQRRQDRAEDRALRATLAGNRQEPLQKVIDPETGDTIYVPRSQAVGMKAPAGAGRGAGAGGGRMPAEIQRMSIAFDALDKGLNEYEQALKKFNVRSVDQLDPAQRATINSLHARITAEAKEAAALGALTGPDLELLDHMIANPASAKGAYYGSEGLGNQVGQARTWVKNRREAVGSMYPGTQQPSPPPGAPKPAVKYGDLK